MTNIVLASAKYLIILLFALFTYASFMVQRDVPEEKKKGTVNLQRVLVFAVHALAFFSIFINVSIGNAAGMTRKEVLVIYVCQLLFLVFIMCILPHIVHLSVGLNNVMCMLLTVGFIIQTRLSYDTGFKHLIYTAVSAVVYIVAALLCKKVKLLYRMTWVYCIVSLALLLAVFVFAKVSLGAKTSIDLGFVSIQPFEFVKIIFVMFIAAAFNKANDFKTVAITAMFGAAHVIILVMCSELGTALILAVVYVLMLYVATKKAIYLLICLVVFVGACIAAYTLFSHVQVRVDVWLDPWADIDNKGYQITQSLFAIGTGGWLGSGLYNGSPSYIPMVYNDFVFSAISEELGAIFAIFLILLCLCFVLMSFRIAIRVSKPFYKLLAFGLGAVYGMEVFLTIGGAIKFVPSTGINLPFISSGGSSVLASMILVAMIQALYVISEEDVEMERELIEARIVYGDEGLVPDIPSADTEKRQRSGKKGLSNSKNAGEKGRGETNTRLRRDPSETYETNIRMREDWDEQYETDIRLDYDQGEEYETDIRLDDGWDKEYVNPESNRRRVRQVRQEKVKYVDNDDIDMQ